MTTDSATVEGSQPHTHSKSVEAALTVMQAHIDALNNRDEEALAATLHFPHYRLVDGKVMMWESGGSYFADFRKRAGSDWHQSKWGKLNVIHAGANKVHLDVQVDRYNFEGKLLTSFSSMWVIAQLNNRWAALLRSSFAPDIDIMKQLKKGGGPA